MTTRGNMPEVTKATGMQTEWYLAKTLTDTANGDSFFDSLKSAVADTGLYFKDDVQNLVVVDRISALPDDLIVSIVSLLPLKEAAATSVLSTRWRHIWTFVTTLDFHHDILFQLRSYKRVRIESELDMYLNWVNSVMKQHRGPCINLLRVYADINDPKYESSIHTWGRFALEKRVQNFDLLLSKNRGFPKRGGNEIKAVFSTFPLSHQFVNVDRLGSDLCSKPDILHPCLYTCFSAFSCLKYLRVLEFRFVLGLTGQVLECFLSHCPLLERLTVVRTLGLDSFKVIGPSIALKYLHIHKHTGPVNIEICDVKLVTFIYGGGGINLLLKNVPQLVEVSISSRRVSFGQCGSHHQLEVFRLRGFVLNNEKHVLPTYVNLKYLELGLKERDSCCLLQLMSFMEASPYLHKLVLKLETTISRSYRREMEVKQAPNYSHQFLRVVEVTDYHGRTSDLELVRYLIENAVELKELLMHPVRRWFSRERIRFRMGNREEVERIEKEERKQATQQLKELVPSSLEFICRL
uniref:putative FBD-associated F-box protein At5g56440 n=1 Tax=Fragaria vesca subsp. vesca TaxID=101020 RepID=UPI0005CA944C|nr:PREDICTED: putative FBD-associated F-box protein At5g56440 [Fragaria vesca subsp. vesca]